MRVALSVTHFKMVIVFAQLYSKLEKMAIQIFQMTTVKCSIKPFRISNMDKTPMGSASPPLHAAWHICVIQIREGVER
jgi:hypothetical protein